MTLEYLKKFVKEQIEKNSSLKDEIEDLYELALQEIADGASVSNEINICINDIKDLNRKGIF